MVIGSSISKSQATGQLGHKMVMQCTTDSSSWNCRTVPVGMDASRRNMHDGLNGSIYYHVSSIMQDSLHDLLCIVQASSTWTTAVRDLYRALEHCSEQIILFHIYGFLTAVTRKLTVLSAIQHFMTPLWPPSKVKLVEAWFSSGKWEIQVNQLWRMKQSQVKFKLFKLTQAKCSHNIFI